MGAFINNSISACSTKKEKKFKTYIWMHVPNLTKNEWKKRLNKLREYHISGLLVKGKNQDLEKFITVARDFDFEIQLWIFTLLRNDKKLIKEHPDWYNVNRRGESSIKKPPYVDYYKWLCPTREEVREYIKQQVIESMQINGIDGIHLDYIRYPDVILPEALQPKYGLDQTQELPQYDFCYCEVCRDKFKSIYGTDPLSLHNPAKNSDWLKFRYESIIELVNLISKVVHTRDKKLTAAVFPTPEIARKLVRQNWPAWNLDAVFPMMYNNYYNKSVSWIKKATEEGQQALSKKFPLYAGIYATKLSPQQIVQATQYAESGGADGVSLFRYYTMSDFKWRLWDKNISNH